MKTKSIIFIAALTLFAISTMTLILVNKPEKKHDFNIPELSKKLSPAQMSLMRAEYEFERTRDPGTNQLPPNIKAREMLYVAAMPDIRSLKNKRTELLSVEWVNRGPANIGGRMKCIAFDIRNEDILLAGSASGGLWRSMDAGQSWTKTTAPNVVQSATCIEQDSREGKNDIWYYGTGELLSTTDRKISTVMRTIGCGNGIFKSIDNGATWEQLESTTGGHEGQLSEVFQGVWDIAIDHTVDNKDIVYAACYGAIMRSTDGGASWEKVLGDLENKAFCTDIEISSDGTKFAAISNFTMSGIEPSIHGIFRSNDGENWVDITHPDFHEYYRTVKLEIAPSNENIIYAFTEQPVYDDNPWYYFTQSIHNIWKLTYDSEKDKYNYINLSDNLPYQDFNHRTDSLYNSLGGYAFFVEAHPEEENMVFLGGINLIRSFEAFSSPFKWKNIAGYGQDQWFAHPDMHDMVFLNSDPNAAYLANDGGIHKTNNISADSVIWRNMDNALLTSQFYAVAIDESGEKKDWLVGGLQDNNSYMTITDDPAESWFNVGSGDGMDCAIASKKDFILTSAQNGYIIGLKYTGGMDSVSGAYLVDENRQGDYRFYTNFELDPVTNDILYVCKSNNIIRKKDVFNSLDNWREARKNWEDILQNPLENEQITAIEMSEKHQNIIFFGTNKGNLYGAAGVDNGTVTHEDLTGSEFPKNGFISCIHVDDHENSEDIYVVFSNYNVNSIYRSTDFGSTWHSISGNLEENPDGTGAGPSVRWFDLLYTEYGDTVYFAATSSGLFATTHLNGDKTSWTLQSPDQMGNIITDMVVTRESDGLVAVATQGYGIWTSNIDKDHVSVNSSYQKSVSLYQNYPNPALNSTTIEFHLPQSSYVEMKLYDISGNSIKTLTQSYFKQGRHKINLSTAKLSPGAYFYRLSASGEIITKKMIVGKR